MERHSQRFRGASSAVAIVIITVVFFLLALGTWMWVDMNRNDLEGKAKTYVEVKKHGGAGTFIQPASGEPELQFVTGPASGVNESSGIYDCRHAANPIVIDGLPNDAAWRDAAVLNAFGQPWLGPNHPAKTRTTARLLWDDQYLYFLAEMDDLDVWADITQHNGDLWNNDVFELFLKPSVAQLGYYEFEINAQNATLEAYFPSRGSGGLRRWGRKTPFHVESKVSLRAGSTLNDPTDRDTGWVVEGRIPWTDFGPTGGKPKAGDEWRFALCRFDFSVQNDEPEMSTSAPLKVNNFHRYEDYAVLRFK